MKFCNSHANIGSVCRFSCPADITSEAKYVRLTSGWLGSQLGGKAEERTLGTMAVMMRSRKRCASTAVLIVVGGNMLETDWGVEQGWEGERA